MTRRLCFGGLVGAAVFFALAMTPSLIPRSWTIQGVLAGLTAAIGYGFGSAVSAAIRAVLPAEPATILKRRAWIGLGVIGPMLVLVSLAAGSQWDEELRRRMGMDIEETWNDVGTVLLAVATALFLLAIARVVRGIGRVCTRALRRRMPRAAVTAIGGGLVALVIILALVGVLTRAVFISINESAGVFDRTFHPDVDPPDSALRSGSEESLISWDDLGARGRQFVAGGPPMADIEAFAGPDVVEPIRVYGGLRSASSLDARVELLLDELDRVDAWSRRAIIVQTPSGNGEIPRVNADAPELILGGDVAQVALQYSYAPSFTTMVTNPGVGDDAGEAIVRAVVDRVDELPADDRPDVYVAGESLGSLSTEAAFDGIDDLAAAVDGALFVGPTLFNDIRNDLTDARDAGTPVWLPTVDDGEIARFAREPTDLAAPTAPWDDTRVVYLQNTSDPVAWFDPRLLWSAPEFLDEPRGPDLSPDMRWIPVVTFWQTLADLPFASGTPAGHGHRYGLNVADGWVAVLDPPDWTGDDTSELREALEQR